ncbi:hypothetical protein BsWGS_24727 [Bradybaena similaris]
MLIVLPDATNRASITYCFLAAVTTFFHYLISKFFTKNFHDFTGRQLAIESSRITTHDNHNVINVTHLPFNIATQCSTFSYHIFPFTKIPNAHSCHYCTRMSTSAIIIMCLRVIYLPSYSSARHLYSDTVKQNERGY